MHYTKSQLAARYAMSKDHGRANIRGLRFREDGGAEATDGHMMIRIKPSVEALAADPKVEPFTLPPENVSALVKSGPVTELDVEQSNVNGTAAFRSIATGAAFTFDKLDPECFAWPKTDQVLSESGPSGEPSFVINLELVERLAKAVKEFRKANDAKGGTVKVYLSDDGLGPIRFVSEALDATLDAVIMPMRND